MSTTQFATKIGKLPLIQETSQQSSECAAAEHDKPLQITNSAATKHEKCRYTARKKLMQRTESSTTEQGKCRDRARKVPLQSTKSATTEHGKADTAEHGKFRYRAWIVHYKLPKVPGYFPCLFFLMVSRMPSYDNFPDTARKMIFFTGLGRDPCGHYPTL